MRTACWPVKRGREKGKQIIVWVCRNMKAEGKIMFNLCNFTICPYFLEHSYLIIQGIPVHSRILLMEIIIKNIKSDYVY
jgi:hypothetical protein